MGAGVGGGGVLPADVDLLDISTCAFMGSGEFNTSDQSNYGTSPM